MYSLREAEIPKVIKHFIFFKISMVMHMLRRDCCANETKLEPNISLYAFSLYSMLSLGSSPHISKFTATMVIQDKFCFLSNLKSAMGNKSSFKYSTQFLQFCIYTLRYILTYKHTQKHTRGFIGNVMHLHKKLWDQLRSNILNWRFNH